MSRKVSGETGDMLSSEMSRREFIRISAAGMLGTHTLVGNQRGQDSDLAQQKVIKRVKKGSMYYRRLGRTGLMISEISLGGSPIPPEPVFRKAMEMGVNYVDTSSSYSNGNSERIIGRMIKGQRDKFHVATEFHAAEGGSIKSTPELIQEAEGSLKRLDTEYVDIFLVHGASSSELLMSEEVLAALDQLKKDGKARFTGVSCHRDSVNVLTPAIESGKYDMISLAYNPYFGSYVEECEVYDNYLAKSGIEKILALAKQNDVGVIAMKSVAGGDRQNLEAFRTEGVSIPQAKLKWVLQNDAVTAAITEMVSFDILDENLAVSGMEMSSTERKVLSEYVKATSVDYCRMCGTCLWHCPSKIAIPDIMRCVAYNDEYGKTSLARSEYRKLPKASTFSGCNQCGICEIVCPYGLQIVQKLCNAHQILA